MPGPIKPPPGFTIDDAPRIAAPPGYTLDQPAPSDPNNPLAVPDAGAQMRNEVLGHVNRMMNQTDEKIPIPVSPDLLAGASPVENIEPNNPETPAIARFAVTPQLGLQRMGHGTVQIAGADNPREAAAGVHNLINGAGEFAAFPTTAPLLFGGAPLVAARAIGTGLLAQHALSGGAKALGVPAPYADVLGDAGGMGAGILGGRPMDSALDGLSSYLFRADPRVALVKGLKLDLSDPGFSERLPGTLGNIQSVSKTPVRSIGELMPAAQKALIKTRVPFDLWMERGRRMGAEASGDPIVEATRAAIPATMEAENPEQAAALVKEAERAYGGGNIGVDKLFDLLEAKQGELNKFYDKSTGDQIAAENAGKPIALVKAQRDAIANQLYNALDPENAGYGPRFVRQRMGDVIKILNAAERHQNQALGQQPVSRAHALGKRAAAFADLFGKAMHGDVEGGLRNLFSGPRATDNMVARAFEEAQRPESLPLPEYFQPRGLLGPAPLTPPPPADTSGPVFAPEPSAASTRLIPGPSRVQNGGFAVGEDMVPVRGQSGHIEYVPRWMLQKNIHPLKTSR